MSDETKCNVCKTKNQIMKRCTRCHSVFYCSKECQISDWKTHRQICQQINSRTNSSETSYKDDGSIFTESKPQGKITIHHRPAVDFHKASKDLQNQKPLTEPVNRSIKPENSYLHCNQYKTDLPVIDESQPFCEITVKCNKQKQKLKIQNAWSGDDIFKVFSNKLNISYEKIKVINKGKILTFDTIASAISNKAIFQVIGEQAANEDGLDTGDVDVLMKQMGVDRNEAVMALRKCGDVVDAIIELGKK
ncbi:uncharacterized protein LOC143042625 isoform X2 [Mytilus galloprovincialis]